MSKRHRERAKRKPPREGHELRRLVDWGRHLKNKRLADADTRDGDNLDLLPRAEVYRDEDMIAIVFLVGDRDQSYRTLHGAIVGYGADEVRIIWDSYGYQASAEEFEERRFAPGQFERWFHSPDPAERALVSEALICCRYKRNADGTLLETMAQAQYDYDPKKHKFRWRAVHETSAPDGDMHSLIVNALEAKTGLEWMTGILGEPPPDFDAQLAIDINVTKHLVREGGAVLYACKDQATQDAVDEAMKDEPNLYTERKTIRR